MVVKLRTQLRFAMSHMDLSKPNQNVTLKFRNYTPYSKDLKIFCMTTQSTDDLIKELNSHIQLTVKDFEAQDYISNLASRKQNWDLKRDLDIRQSKLKVETEAALRKLAQQIE